MKVELIGLGCIVRFAPRRAAVLLWVAMLIAALHGPSIALAEDGPISGAPVGGAASVEEGRPLGGVPVDGGPAWDPPLGGSTLGGEPVEEGRPLEGGPLGGEPVEQHRPL